MSYTCFGRETKTGVLRILVIIQDRPLFSHIILKVARREIFTDAAGHRSISKNNQTTDHPRFSLTPKQVEHSLKRASFYSELKRKTPLIFAELKF